MDSSKRQRERANLLHAMDDFYRARTHPQTAHVEDDDPLADDDTIGLLLQLRFAAGESIGSIDRFFG